MMFCKHHWLQSAIRLFLSVKCKHFYTWDRSSRHPCKCFTLFRARARLTCTLADSGPTGATWWRGVVDPPWCQCNHPALLLAPLTGSPRLSASPWQQENRPFSYKGVRLHTLLSLKGRDLLPSAQYGDGASELVCVPWISFQNKVIITFTH